MYGSLKSVVAALAIAVGSLSMNVGVEAGDYGHGGYRHGGYRHHHHHHGHHHGYYRGYGPTYIGVPALAVVPPPVVCPAPAPSGFSFSISNGFFGISANNYPPVYGGYPYGFRP